MEVAAQIDLIRHGDDAPCEHVRPPYFFGAKKQDPVLLDSIAPFSDRMVNSCLSAQARQKCKKFKSYSVRLTYTAWSDEDECNVRSHHKYQDASAHTEKMPWRDFCRKMPTGESSTDNVMKMDGWIQASFRGDRRRWYVYVRTSRRTKSAPKFIGFRSIVANKIGRVLRAKERWPVAKQPGGDQQQARNGAWFFRRAGDRACRIQHWMEKETTPTKKKTKIVMNMAGLIFNNSTTNKNRQSQKLDRQRKNVLHS